MMPTIIKPTVRVGCSHSIRVTVPLDNDAEMRTWLIYTKKVAGYVSRDYENKVDKEITVIYFVDGNKEQDFYKAVEEWCQQKGYSVQLQEPTQ